MVDEDVLTTKIFAASRDICRSVEPLRSWMTLYQRRSCLCWLHGGSCCSLRKRRCLDYSSRCFVGCPVGGIRRILCLETKFTCEALIEEMVVSCDVKDDYNLCAHIFRP